MDNVSKISTFINGSVKGDPKLKIKGICDIETGKINYISVILSKNYEKYIDKTKASALVVSSYVKIPQKSNKTFIIVENPSKSFVELLEFYDNKIFDYTISKKAIISKKSFIGKNCSIEENVIIKDNVKIGDNVIIKSGSIIDNNSTIGSKTFINANVTINHGTEIGERCFIESGTVIGSDGFGTVKYDGKHVKIPHIGKVIIKDDVLFGSNCTVDRGTINNTIINKNTKIDNMVHIGHNVSIGESCLICAQTGIGGSCNIGDNVVIGGKVGFIDHINVGNNSMIVAHSMVYKSIPSNSYFSGDPARNHKDRIKQDILISKISDIYKKMKK